MIDRLEGRVRARGTDYVVVDCGGVGYRLSVSAQTLEQVPPIGRPIDLLAHLIMRDDGIVLYGFASDGERELFQRLISVSGVGPKMALTALSGSSAGEMRQAIATGDAKRFQVVPGIGKKTAERVIVELREVIAGELGAAPATAAPDGDPRSLAREGLAGLGYEISEAEAMLVALGPGAEGSSAEELIAAALRAAVRAA
jgi:Holliday junction DNA helicase RuvA